MQTKNLLITCIWSNNDFVVIESKNAPTSDEAVLKIDESSETISVTIPSSISLINTKIIERRVQSIAKSGFSVPNTSLRIGGGFKVEMKKSEGIPDILLQEGHKYTYGEFPPPPIETSPDFVTESKIISESEYIPSFLAHEPVKDDIVSDILPDSEPPVIDTHKGVIESQTVEKQVSQERVEAIPNQIAGSFIVALSEYGDVYLSKKDDNYSIEYSMGRVDFSVKDSKIEILSTQRIPDNDQTLQRALDKVMKHIS